LKKKIIIALKTESDTHSKTKGVVEF